MYKKNDGDELELLIPTTSLTSQIKAVFIKNYIKPTAKNRVLVNRKSHYTRSIYKPIIFGESIRLRRLCERDCECLESIKG